MKLVRTLSSRNFFIFNLVLIGIIFGFFMAFISFSCSAIGGIARAQDMPPVEIPQDALIVAESMQRVLNAVSDRVLPSVVEVNTVSVQRQRQAPGFDGIPWDFFFGPPGERGGEDNRDREFRSRAMGSGIIIRQDRNLYYVVTNNHVIEGATEILIGTRDGREYPADIVGRDARRDLAVLSFTSNERFPLAELGDSDSVKVGDWAIAMGNPLGRQFSFSVTMGIISAVGRTGGPGGNINDFIQTDASINQGNSGGPLVNIRGEVIGINTWIASNVGGGSVGLGFAIPINNAKRVIEDIITTGDVRDGWLGVLLSDPDRATIQDMRYTDLRGSMVVQVSLGSPADRGGMRAGDFVTHVNDREVRGTNQLIQMVGDMRPGEQSVFRVFRSGSTINLNVTIEARVDAAAADNRRLWPGLSVVPITSELRSNLRLGDDAEGLYVTQVIEGSPAYITNIRRGDRILTVNGIAVPDLNTFYRVLREGTGTELQFGFMRGESTLESIKFIR
ncbi:MAG: Do family serine endopeptidase [Treponema sp.]|nr:Do family serine endopeptidase [Treponema sp.]